MSRAYNAKRKAKRKQARTAREDATAARRWHPPRPMAVIPALVIAAILATVGVLGFGGNSAAIDKKEIQQRVSKLLAGIPQQGTALGSRAAPITLRVYADLECPTVKRFVTTHLPSIIETWVRNGTVKLEYRSLRTDTGNRRIFFKQEAAALAAGRQSELWNYALTFVHEQGQKGTHYVTDEFLADIASQVPSLDLARWRKDRQDPSLYKKVNLALKFAHSKGLYSTPSFLLDVSVEAGGIKKSEPAREEVEASLRATVDALNQEDLGDVPTLGILGGQKESLEEIEGR